MTHVGRERNAERYSVCMHVRVQAHTAMQEGGIGDGDIPGRKNFICKSTETWESLRNSWAVYMAIYKIS